MIIVPWTSFPFEENCLLVVLLYMLINNTTRGQICREKKSFVQFLRNNNFLKEAYAEAEKGEKSFVFGLLGLEIVV